MLKVDGIDPVAIASEWFSKFVLDIESTDIDSLSSNFFEDGWLKDFLTYTWGYRALRGRDKIRSYLANTLASSQISDLALDNRQYLAPELFDIDPQTFGVQGAFTFETPKAFGRGNFKLLKDVSSGEWKALCLMTMIADWKGHEEIAFESGHFEGHNLSWEEVRQTRRIATESDPQVIIVGGGQTGLQVAARFRQMKIRALVIDMEPRVGDSWRLRYPTLVLHTPKNHHTLLYQPYPSNWPFYTSKDKLANWLEQYTETHDLVVWTSSYLEPTPRYDEVTKTWDVVINRDGENVALRPQHIIMAISFMGDESIPTIPGLENFSGDYIHTCRYKGGNAYKGKRVVVIGAGNSSADMCQDLVYRGASSVTMIQRSPSGFVTERQAAYRLMREFPDGLPTDIADFKVAGLPLGLLREIMKKMLHEMIEFDKEELEMMRKGGFEVHFGADGSGQPLMIYDRGGGYYVDVGCAKLIGDGIVKVRSRVSVERITENSVILSDGSELPAESIIFATGWKPVREKLRPLFGDNVIDKTSDLWGTNEEGEVKCGYVPSGQPGLWFAVGDFGTARFYSKPLALQIKAIELGYMTAW